MTWLRQSLTSPFGIYVRGFFSFSFSRVKLFTPKIVNPLYWTVFANPIIEMCKQTFCCLF